MKKFQTGETCKGCKFCQMVEDDGKIKYYCNLDNEEIKEEIKMEE